MGFSSDLVVGVYVGFDTPSSLGKLETGAAVALPVWKDFMENALKDVPDVPFRRPAGIKMVKIDSHTGQLPTPDTPKENIIFEAFKENTEPGAVHENATIIDNDNNNAPSENNEDSRADGVY